MKFIPLRHSACGGIALCASEEFILGGVAADPKHFRLKGGVIPEGHTLMICDSCDEPIEKAELQKKYLPIAFPARS